MHFFSGGPKPPLIKFGIFRLEKTCPPEEKKAPPLRKKAPPLKSDPLANLPLLIQSVTWDAGWLFCHERIPDSSFRFRDIVIPISLSRA